MRQFIGDTHFETEDIQNNEIVERIRQELIRDIARRSNLSRAEVEIQTENRQAPPVQTTEQGTDMEQAIDSEEEEQERRSESRRSAMSMSVRSALSDIQQEPTAHGYSLVSGASSPASMSVSSARLTIY
jgi:nitrogenase subunit NifH